MENNVPGVVRVCLHCRMDKPITDFNKDKTRPLGRSYICRPCGKAKDFARYRANPEKERARGVAFYHKTADRQRALRVKRYHADPVAARAAQKLDYELNGDKRRSRRREYYHENPERDRLVTQRWAKANPEKVRGGNKVRADRVKRATPSWLSEGQKMRMRSIYIIRDILTELTGVKHDVDHIFPIYGGNSSGLHVPWNLRVIPKSKNASKRNTVPDGIHAVMVGV